MSDSTKYTTKLSSTRILIIGGSSGIGYAVAEACLESGATVIISSSQPTRIASAITSLLKTYPSATSRLSGRACDLSSPTNLESNIAALFAHATGADAPLNHVIHTAGDTLTNLPPLQDLTLESFQQAGMVRFFAAILIAKHAARHLPHNVQSSITLTTGSASQKPIPGWAAGSAYGAGLHGMMRGLALDLAPVRVNLISPGAVQTPLWDGLPKEMVAGFMKMIEQRTTTGVIGRAEDVAESYLFVLKDANCTGSVIDTNGGAFLT